MPTRLTPDDINAAILGYESQKAQIDAKIAELHQRLDGKTPKASDPAQLSQPPNANDVSARPAVKRLPPHRRSAGRKHAGKLLKKRNRRKKPNRSGSQH